MSNVSTQHDVTAYITGKSHALSGQRLAKVTYKTPKDGGAKKESKCVSIPLVSTEQITENLQVLIPALKSFLEGQQDMIIRKLVDAGATEIGDNEIDMKAIAAHAEEETTGARMTKESIGAWFDSSVADSLRVAFADRLGISDTPTAEDMFKVETAVATYKDKFSALAGGKTYYAPEVAEKLVKVLQLVPDDELAIKFSVRLEKMSKPASVDLLGL